MTKLQTKLVIKELRESIAEIKAALAERDPNSAEYVGLGNALMAAQGALIHAYEIELENAAEAA